MEIGHKDFLLALTNKVQSNPDSTQYRLNLIYALDSLQEYSTALQQIDTLIAADSLNYSWWYIKGQIAENAGDTTMAEDSYTNAITIYDSPDALLGLANIYAEKKDARALQIAAHLQSLPLAGSMMRTLLLFQEFIMPGKETGMKPLKCLIKALPIIILTWRLISKKDYCILMPLNILKL